MNILKTTFRKSRALFAVLLFFISLSASAQINTDQVLNIGRNAMYFEDYVLSIQYFNQVIKSKPYLAEPYFYRAVAKISLEDYKGAEEDCSLSIERNPFIVDAYQVRGVARQYLKDYKGAIEDYDRGLKQMPEDKTFLMNRAACEGELKNYDEANKTFATLLRLDPKNDRAYLGVAQLKLAQKDTTTALENINKSLELSKNNSSAYVMRSMIEMNFKKDFKSALADMDEAIKLEPHYAGYFINRAFMKYHLDDYFGAMSDYDYAVGLDPTSIEAHFNRGLLLTEVGENNKAITDFSYVLKSEPDQFLARYNRALLFFKTGQYKSAVSDYNVVLKKYPAFEAGYMARGEAKRKMGDKSGGDKDYEFALSLFKRKRSHVSNYDPMKIEAKESEKKSAQKEAANGGSDDVETQTEIMNKFNTLLTVETDNKIKPEYDNRSRGHIQNSNIEIEPEPLFTLSYYAKDNKLTGNTNFLKEITDVNDTHLLPNTLTLTNEDNHLTEEQINKHFSSIEYYNGLLATAKPRSIDYFARCMDFLMVKNPVSALADATRAIEKSPNFSLAYFLRANVRYMQYAMANTDATESMTKTKDEQASSLLREHEKTNLLSQITADLDTVIKLTPKNVYAYFDKGNIFMLQNDFTSAISCYSTAISIKPDLGEAYYNRGLMYLRMGNKEKGINDLSKAGELGILPSYNVLKRMNN
jgi:tetratricopeptide (TPR) repeat protein